MRIARFLIYLALLTATSSEITFAQNASNEIRVALGTTCHLNIFRHVIGPYQELKGVKIKVEIPSETITTRQLFEAVEKDQVEASCSALSWSDVSQVLKSAGLEKVNVSQWKNWPIGSDIIRVFLPKSNPLNSLTETQIKGLFTGKIKNWREIGGKNENVAIFVVKEQSAANTVFKNAMLGGEDFSSTAQVYSGPEATLKHIAKIPGAIALNSIGYADVAAEVKIPRQPNVSRKFTFFTKATASAKVAQFVEWLASEGQRYIPEP